MNRKLSFLPCLVAVGALLLPGQVAVAAFVSQGIIPCSGFPLGTGDGTTCLVSGNDDGGSPMSNNPGQLPGDIVPENVGNMELVKLGTFDAETETSTDSQLFVTGPDGSNTASNMSDDRLGTWEWTGLEQVFYIGVKDGGGQQYELWDVLSLGNMGCWATDSFTSVAICAGIDLVSQNTGALSHLTIWGKSVDGGPPQLIPIPAAGWLFLSAVAGLVVVGRRRKAPVGV